MGKRRRRRNRKRQERARKHGLDLLITGMFLLAIYFALFGGEYTLFELEELRSLRAERAAELQRTESTLDSLHVLAARLRDDPETIERVARERYGMIRDGEILYRFRDTSANEGPESRE